MIIGIDISKNKFDVAFSQDNSHYQFENTSSGIKAFIKKLKKASIKLVALENTGGYEKPLVKALFDKGYAVHLAEGKRIHYFAKMKGYLAKTDKKDAFIIAEYAIQNKLEENASAYLKDIELRELQARLNRLTATKANERKLLDKNAFSKEADKSVKRIIKLLETEIELINEKIQALIAQDEEKVAAMKRYQTVKGIGPVVAQALVVNLSELGDRDRSKIAALAGVAPINNDSGKKEGYRKIQGGRCDVKRALYQAALSAARYNPYLNPYYEKLLAKGKKKRVAQVAVMRKLVVIVNAMQRDKLNWDDLAIANIARAA